MFHGFKRFFDSSYTFDKLIDRYLSDYLNNESIWDSLPSMVRDNLREEVDSYRNASLQDEKAGLVFRSIQLINAVKWLNDSGYGEKLISKLDRLQYKDDYDDYVYDDVHKELETFVEKRIDEIVYSLDGMMHEFYVKCATKMDCLYSLLVNYDGDRSNRLDRASDIILEASHLFRNHNCAQTHRGFEVEDPYEYEEMVAEKLRCLGWKASVTPGSGDQGADVIAELNKLKLVVQCKLYSKPVGNKAVQEVASAQQFFGGDFAAVVSNNDYTKSARQLAESLGVFLMHHSELAGLSRSILGSENFEIESRPESWRNIIDIAHFLADKLESLEWETSYDPDESVDEEGGFHNLLLAVKHGISVVIGCTSFEKMPVDESYVDFTYDFFKTSGSYDILAITSSTGFTDGAVDTASRHSILLIENSEISDLERLFEDS